MLIVEEGNFGNDESMLEGIREDVGLRPLIGECDDSKRTNLPDEFWVRVGGHLDAVERLRFSTIVPLFRRTWLSQSYQTLVSSQRVHAARMESLLKSRAPSAVDLSLMGSGKTYTSNALARSLGLNLAVICPNATKSNWRSISNSFGFYNVDLVCKPTKPRVRKTDSQTRKRKRSSREEDESERTNASDATAWVMNYERLAVGGYGRLCRDATGKFEASPIWISEVRRGVLLVLDESHFLKNEGRVRTDAAMALVEPIYREFCAGGKSRVLILTGTPMDNVIEQSPLLARLMGLYRRPLTRVDSVSGRVAEGLSELLDSAGFSAKEREETVARVLASNSSALGETVTAVLLKRVAKERFFSMPPPVLPTKFDVANEFCRISDEGRRVVSSGVQKLRIALSFLSNCDRNDQVAIARAFNMIRGAMVTIQLGKVEILVRRTREILRQNPRSKVIIALSVVEAIRECERRLAEFRPMVYFGKTPLRERQEILNAFQSESLDRRLLVCNQSMCANGIPMHDLHGNRPRTLLAVPSHHLLEMLQMSYRVHRMGGKSDATVRWIYVQGDAVAEHELLRNISRKCQDLQKCFEFCSSKSTANTVPLPHEYPNVNEPDPPFSR